MGGGIFRSRRTPMETMGPYSTSQTKTIPSYIETPLRDNLIPRGVEESSKNRVISFNPTQQQALQMMKALPGQNKEALAEIKSLLDHTGTSSADIDYERYMNPYKKNVMERDLFNMRSGFEAENQKLDSQAATLNAFGGDRYAIEKQRQRESQERLLGDARAKHMDNAYRDAQGIVKSDDQRFLDKVSALMGWSQVSRSSEREDAHDLFGAGKLEQDQAQIEENQTRKNLEFLSSVLRGNPMSETITGTHSGQTKYGYNSPWKEYAALAMNAAAAAKGGGFK